MDKIYENCCGINVQKAHHCLLQKGQQAGNTGVWCSNQKLLEMADWLREGGCEMTAMESTAFYWKSLFKIPESSGLNAMVVNARHMKAVPGRKTNAKDAEWVAELLQHRLLQPSYILIRIDGTQGTGQLLQGPCW